jgi:23S rRNA pseudouridine2605 synthase
MSKGIRLQRFLAQAGIASRRKAEELILSGRVAVNGRTVRELGTTVDPRRDRVTFDGTHLVPEDRLWLLLNKPPRTVSTVADPEGRQTVLDLVPSQGARLYPVGRLDYNTEGVLLLTNDGELAAALMHPRNKIPRVYHVKLKGIVDPDDLDKLRRGVTLDTGEKVSAEVHILGTTEMNTWIEMTLTQGLNRQVHRMVERMGGTVLRLIRVAYAGLTVERLRPGRYRALTQVEVDELRAAVKLKAETVRSPTVKPGRRARGERRTQAPRREEADRAGRARTSRKRTAQAPRREETDNAGRARTSRKPIARHRQPPRG